MLYNIFSNMPYNLNFFVSLYCFNDSDSITEM